MRSICTIIILFTGFGILAQSDIEPGTFTDPRDGKRYRTIQLGSQVWFAENLDYKTISGSCTYENDLSVSTEYGRLYTWEAAQDVCPAGWHLPDDSEWKEMELAIGLEESDLDEMGWRGTDQGHRLKATENWSQDGNGTDDFGFAALPAGFSDCRDGFGSLGRFAYFWSATESENAKKAWIRKLYYPTDAVGRSSYNKSFGFSVRCVKN